MGGFSASSQGQTYGTNSLLAYSKSICEVSFSIEGINLISDICQLSIWYISSCSAILILLIDIFKVNCIE